MAPPEMTDASRQPLQSHPSPRCWSVSVPIAEVIRAAVAEHVEARKQDRRFQESLRERIERAQAMLGSAPAR
jgi:hypothetical protein